MTGRFFGLPYFSNYYQSSEMDMKLAEGELLGVEVDAQNLAGQKTTDEEQIKKNAASGLTVEQRLAAVNLLIAKLTENASTVPEDKKAYYDRVLSQLSTKVSNYEFYRSDKSNARSAEGALGSAECRMEVRSANTQISEGIYQMEMATGITIATAGVGSWLSVARAASQAGTVATTGTAWAAEASGSALFMRGADALNKYITYKQQATVLWAVMLGADTYWFGDGLKETAKVCHELISKNSIQVFQKPMAIRNETCLEDREALQTITVADYQGCMMTGAMILGLNALTVYPTLHEFKSGPLGAVH